MKNNKKIKGFTLIELIIVMAIFGILLIGVMTLIDPVSKTMTNTAVQGNNAASVNNIKEYLENSLKYSEYIAVHNGGYSIVNPSGGRSASDEQAAVQEFVDDYYKDRIDNTDSPITGTVRVLKIDNADGGRIYESSYDFTAGQTYVDNVGNEQIVAGKGSVVTYNNDQVSVINDVYYDNYSYFIRLGYNQSEPMQEAVASAAPFNLAPSDDATFYYTMLSEVRDDTGNSALYPFSQAMFSMSVMTYQNDGAFMGTFDLTDDPATAYNEAQTVQVFRSPVYLANSTMSLPNMNSATVFKKAYGIQRDTSGNPITDPATGTTSYYDLTADGRHYIQPKVNNVQAPANAASTTQDDIYFIYTLPKDVTR